MKIIFVLFPRTKIFLRPKKRATVVCTHVSSCERSVDLMALPREHCQCVCVCTLYCKFYTWKCETSVSWCFARYDPHRIPTLPVVQQERNLMSQVHQSISSPSLDALASSKLHRKMELRAPARSIQNLGMIDMKKVDEMRQKCRSALGTSHSGKHDTTKELSKMVGICYARTCACIHGSTLQNMDDGSYRLYCHM